MTKQITIYDLLPLLKKGWVAYNSTFGWLWFDKKPKKHETMYYLDYPNREFVYAPHPFKELAPFDGDWQDSLIKVEHKEEDDWLMVDKSTGPEWYKNGKRIK